MTALPFIIIAAASLILIALEAMYRAWRQGYRRGAQAGWDEGYLAGRAEASTRVPRAHRPHLHVVRGGR